MSDIVPTYGKYLRVGYERPKEIEKRERERTQLRDAAVILGFYIEKIYTR